MQSTLPFTFGNSAVVWMLGILGLLIWMLFHPRENFSPKILLFILAFLVLGPACDAVMHTENHRFPLKFDYFLYLVDQSLGISAFWVARHFSEWQRSVLFQIYESLTLVMIAWYGVNLKTKDGQPRRLLTAYGITFLVGPCLYLILPACGPRHAFGAAFPMETPSVSAVLIKLDGWPNAIPSLHVSTALVLAFFAGRNQVLRWIAWTYVAGTVLATLAFEHYVVDLIVAAPFACFVTRAAKGNIRKATGHLGIVFAWILAIRYATPTLVEFPAVLRILALCTVAWSGFSMAGKRTLTRDASQLAPDLGYAAATTGHDWK
jgi:hypothetical protein